MAKADNFESWNELKEFAARLPPGRRIAGYAGIPAFFIFPILFGCAYYYEWGYTAGLVLAFLWFLFMTHSKYAFLKNLTQSRVRKIDYWYLGAASIGLLVFAIGYANQREMLFGKAMTSAFRIGEEKFRDDVVSRHKQFQSITCSPNVVRLSNRACEASTRFIDEIKPGLSLEQVKTLEERFRMVAEQYTRLYAYDQIQKIPNFFMPQAVVKVAIDDWRKYMEYLPTTAEPKRDENIEMLFGVGQIIVWPFLFAYALALRITKVTIDVFEWAK
jgi:hypothetical protein